MTKKAMLNRAAELARTRAESLKRRAETRKARAKLEETAHNEAVAQMQRDAGRRSAEQTLPEAAPPQN